MMNEKDLLSIKKFSAFTGIEQSTLRYYDEIGLFSPIKREKSGYRYYSPAQIIAVNLINVLSSLKFPLKRIQGLSVHRTPDLIMNLIEQQELRLDDELNRLRESYSVIHTFRKLIKEGILADTDKISVFPKEEMRIAFGEENQFAYGEVGFYRNFLRFCEQAPKFKINLNYPVGGCYKNIESFLKNPSRPERFFSVDPAGSDRCEAGSYLTGYTRGYYGEMGDLPQRMKDYAEAHSLTLSGQVYVIYLHDEISLENSKDYLAQASLRIAEP